MEAPTTTTTTDSSDVVFKLLGWLHANRKPLIAGTATVAVIAIAAGLYNWKQGQNELDANAKLLSFPVGSDLRVHAPAGALQQLATEYPSSSSGEFAALLTAENYYVAADFIDAQRAFSKFLTDYPASALVPQAGLGVAASLEAQGKIPEATQQYQKVINDSPTEFSVVNPAKLTLGRLAEEQGHFDQAFNQYRELAQSANQNDLWSSEARQRLQILVANHPEILKAYMAANAPQSAAPAATPAAPPTLSAGPAAALSSAPAASNAAPHLLQLPSTPPAQH